MTLRFYIHVSKVAGVVDADGPKHPAAQQFIERLMRIAQTESVAEFAARTGQPERYVYRWKNGSHAPSFLNAVEMLEQLGLLRWTDTPISLTGAQEKRRVRLLAEAEHALARLREELR